jgi:hypothetical protein
MPCILRPIYGCCGLGTGWPVYYSVARSSALLGVKADSMIAAFDAIKAIVFAIGGCRVNDSIGTDEPGVTNGLIPLRDAASF